MNRESDPQLVSLDIETTGIDWQTSQLVAVGLALQGESKIQLGAEQDMLTWLESEISNFEDGTILVTWNGEEFDLPFLFNRFGSCNIATTLSIEPQGVVGKYGKPLYTAHWSNIRHVDLAPLFKEYASVHGIQWSLKPLVREALKLEPVVVDNRGSSIAVMDQSELSEYLASDIEITLLLAKSVPTLLGIVL